jgi:lysozyme
MKTSQAGIDLIKEFEGCKLKPYKDVVGLLTVGYGHRLAEADNRDYTQEEVDEFLRSDLERFERGVLTYITVPLTQGQFDSLVCFSYNLGLGTLQRSTLRQKILSGDGEGAAKEILRFDKAGGVVVKGLTRRRQAEYRLFTQIDPITDTSTSDT